MEEVVSNSASQTSKIIPSTYYLIHLLGGLDSTGIPFDSVEAWAVMSDEILEFQVSCLELYLFALFHENMN